MTNPLTAGREALIARLQTITKAAGYLTDAGGNVRSGWFNEVQREEGSSFPMLVVQKDKASSEPQASGGDVLIPQAFNVVGAVQAGTDYEQAIEDLAVDLVRCLTPQDGLPVSWRSPGMHKVTIDPPETYPPGEGLSAATVLLRIEMSIVINGA